MKNFILIISSILFFSCTPQQEVSSKQVKEKKEGRKIYGSVSEKYLKESLSEAEWKAAKKPDLSFNVDNEYFYIKIANTNITEADLNKLIGKKIEVQGKLVGEGYGGEVSVGMPPMKKPSSKGGATKEKPIGSIIIYEILDQGE